MKPTLFARGAILVLLAIAAFGYRAWLRAHAPEPIPVDTTYWQPTPETRLGGDSTFEFKYRWDGYFVDSKAGTVTRDADRGPVAHFRLTRIERDSIKHAVLASGFFDWPETLGNAYWSVPSGKFRLLVPVEIADASRLYARAGMLENDVWRVDRFGRDDESRANREAKSRMSDLEHLIHHLVDEKPEFKKLPEPPYYH